MDPMAKTQQDATRKRKHGADVPILTDAGREGLVTGAETHAELAAETPTRTGCAEMTLTGAGARVEPTHAEPTAETPARAGLTHAEPTAEAPARAELAHAEMTAETPARADTAPQPPKPKKRMRKSKDVKKWTKKTKK